MSLPVEQFVEKLDAIGLLSAAEVSQVTGNLPPDRKPVDVPSLAKLLIREGKLTKYQATAVYQDKSKHLVMGPYVVIDRIGAGGMGQVLKAVHRTMDREVALKILPPGKVNSADSVKRFHQEVRAAAKLLHPNIVAAHDAGEHEGMHFLAMEYVEGQDLSAIVKQQGRLPIEQAVDCIIQAAAGLGFAHEKGIVHRDIKPGNLLLSKDGVVKILDMGLARLNVGDLNEAGSGEGEGLTQSGQVMGTVDYMAPEQALDTRRADHRADIYALGCTLYRLVTGEVPFAGDTMMMKLLAHREQPIPSLREFRPDVSPALDAVYQQMMAKNPDDRQQSMAEVAEQLQAALMARAAPAAARPAAAPAPPRQPEKPSADSALSAFLHNASQPAATTAKKRSSTSAFEETMDHGSSDEGTGERLQEIEPLDVGYAPRTDPIDAEKKKSVRGAYPTRKPWPVPAIAGGAIALAMIIGIMIAFALRGGGDVEWAGDAAPDAALARLDRPLSNDPRAQVSSTAPRNNLTQPATPNAEAGQANPPPQLPPPDFGPGAPSLAVAPFGEPQAKAHQRAWADFLGLPVEKEVDLPSGEKMAFMLIPPGEFMMGSTAQEQARFLEDAKAANDTWVVDRIPSEAPQHRVRITRPYYLGQYEVTQAQWQAVMGSNSSQRKDDPTNPVEQVTWNEIQPFLAKLNEGASAAELKFALPTEAQWEYACRAGTTKYWYSGDSEEDLRQSGWFSANSGAKTNRVGQLRPNAFALYDMHGNVWEWCADWYAADYYAQAPLDDPSGPSAGSERVNRGGCWGHHARRCRSAHREYLEPGRGGHDFGFRLALTIPDSNWRDKAIATQTRHTTDAHSKASVAPAGVWVDVIPLIDPAQDKFDLAKTGKNDWRIEDGELKYHSDGKPGKLLFPLIVGGPSLEWEIEFTRHSVDGTFNTDVPAKSGILPVMFGARDVVAIGKDRIPAAPFVMPTGQRMTVGIRAERSGGQDQITITANGQSVLKWQGDREAIVKPPARDENYSTAERLGLHVQPGDFTFHRVRLRVLQSGTLERLRPADASKLKPAESATSKPITPADGWVDVLPLADPARDVVDGDWKPAGDGLEVAGTDDVYARLMLPIVPKGSYAVELGFTRTKGTEDVAVLLPVADRSVVYFTSAFGRWSGINVIGGAKVHESSNPTRQPTPVVTGTAIKAQVAVMIPDKADVRFVIQTGAAGRVDVTVPISDLDKGAKWKWHDGLTDTSRLGLGAQEVDATINYVKLKMLDGEAEILDRDRVSIAIEQATPELPPTRPADGWIDLLAGGTLDAWHVMRTSGVDNDQQTPASGGWEVRAGTLVCTSDTHGWLKSKQPYGDFVLELEFRLPPDTNSGVFIRSPRQGRTAQLGMEIQVIDDRSGKWRLTPLNITGAIHGAVGPNQSLLRPPGQWNLLRIVCEGQRVKSTVNDLVAVDADMSKVPTLASRLREGYIGISNWKGEAQGAEFRNIRIRTAP